jgi:hypothetical protein
MTNWVVDVVDTYDALCHTLLYYLNAILSVALEIVVM